MRKKTKEHITLTLDMESMTKVRKLAEKQNRNVSNMVDVLISIALKGKTILLLIMFMALVSCRTGYPILDPEAGTIVNCKGSKATVRFQEKDGDDWGEAFFYMPGCDSLINNLTIIPIRK